MYSTSQFHRKYYFGQEEEEMKLCLMILSVPWYTFNGLERTAILSHFLTFITGNRSRLLRIRFSADLTMYWVPVRHFQCMKICPLVIWIWNNNFEYEVLKEKRDLNGNYLALDVVIDKPKLTLLSLYGPNMDNPDFLWSDYEYHWRFWKWTLFTLWWF